MAFGIAGLSVVADSLAAIKYAKVRVIRDETLAVDYRIEGPIDGTNTVPQYGNNDDRVDSIAAELVTRFMQKIRKHPTYRGATHTQSVLTITSNVVYGKHTGNTPDGRRKGEPFGPGANPMHGRDNHGWLASCLSVAKLPYKDFLDGISYTVSVAPQKVHLSDDELTNAAVKAVDMYFGQGGFHMNLNVIDKDRLEDAIKHPDKYPQLTIRVSGYAVNFVKLHRNSNATSLAELSTASSKGRGVRCHSLATSNPEAATICVLVPRPTLRILMLSTTMGKGPSAMSTPTSRPRGTMDLVSAWCCFCRDVSSLCLLPQPRYLAFERRYLRGGTAGDRPPRFICAFAANARRWSHVSGGEPMVQLAFTQRILSAAKEDGPPHGNSDIGLSG